MAGSGKKSKKPSVVEKTSRTLDLLKSFTFSPSLLKTYKQCPYKFYLSQILKMKEPKIIKEEYDASQTRMAKMQASVQNIKPSDLLLPRAEGGPVTAKSPYLVGEKGPEMFVPDTSGDIVPLNGLAGSGAGKRQSVEIANAIKNIISDTFILEKITDADTKRAEKYTVHYKNYIE